MKRSLVMLGVVGVPLVLVGFACTFPEVGFRGPDAGGTSSGGPPDGASDAAAVIDATDRDDASALVDPSECARRPKCDCDEDGWLDRACAEDAGIEAGPDAQVGDCDDLDELTHPGAGYVKAVPTRHQGDWNCDGTIEKSPLLLECGGILCGGEGYLAEPGCGVSGEIYACSSGLDGCKARRQADTNAIQNCR